MTFEASRVQRPRQQVEQQIRAAIITKQLAEGDRLPSEGELAEQFGVSRSTVREALRSLASIGLITKTPGARGGSFVRRMDVDTFGELLSEQMDLFVNLGNASPDDVVSVRAYLEIPAARLAALQRTDSDIDRLRRIVGIQKRTSVDDPEVPKLDVNFHSAIAAASGNRVLSAFVLALHSVSQPVRHIRLSPDVGQATVAQHVAVVHAIEDGDPDAAETAIREHLDYLGSLSYEPAGAATDGRAAPVRTT